MKSIVNKIVLLKVANDKFADFLQPTFLTQWLHYYITFQCSADRYWIFFFKIALPSLILTHCEFLQTRSEWNLNNGQIGGGGTPAAAGMMFAIPIAPIVVTNTSAAALMTNHGLMPTDLMENTGSKMSQASNVRHSNHFQHHQQQQHPHHTVS